ncbi:MAG: alpha-2-macroglobulin family protein [Deferribacteraceae bacterium]|jgi:uncharacterized protein YfaS (alpha-2-macroglobulin family)|nr:alpha-2-macroglobulin family protein [Deferribacteraceae bacterium]
MLRSSFIVFRTALIGILISLFFIIGCRKDDIVDVTASPESEAQENGKPKPLSLNIYSYPSRTSVRIADRSGGYAEISPSDYYEDDYYDDEDDEYYDANYYDEEEPVVNYSSAPANSLAGMMISDAPETELGPFYPLLIGFNDAGAATPAMDISQDINSFIAVTPAINGTWYWYAPDILGFQPNEDWAADTEYKITVDGSIINPKLVLKDNTVKYKTPPLDVKLETFQIYQPAVSETGIAPKPFITATFYFSYEADTESFKKNVSLVIDNKTAEYQVVFDTVHRYAYIKTSPINISAKPGLATLTLTSVKAAKGAGVYREKIAKSIDIPSVEDFFKVNSIYAGLVYNEKREPRQVFTVDFTAPVVRGDLADKLSLYLLPRKYSGSTYYDWRDYNKEVTEQFLRQFRSVQLNIHEETLLENVAGADFLTVENYSNYQLGVFVKKGVKSRNGYETAKDYFRVINIPELPTELRFTQDGNTLALGGDRTLTLMARNISSPYIKIARIQPDSLNHLISQTYGDIKYGWFSGSFNENDISSIYSEEITLNNSDPVKLNYFSFNLSKYLEGRSSAGIFMVEIYKSRNSGYSDRRLIQVTDLGLIIKRNLDKSSNVYVVSLSTGRPVKGAVVYQLARNGSSLFETVTNESGFAYLPDPPDRNAALYPVAIVATNGEDYTFSAYRDKPINTDGFETGGDRAGTDAQVLRGYLFTERGIYRPGDTVHIASIVKQDDWKALEGIPMEFSITNPRNQQVLYRRFTLTNDGFNEIEFPTEYSSETGEYSIRLNLVNNSGSRRFRYSQLGSSVFKIEEFKPDTMKLNLLLEGSGGKGWLSFDDVSLTAVLNNLYGRPAQNRRIKAVYQISPATFNFPAYRDYIFTEPYRESNYNRSYNLIRLPEGVTDERGRLNIPLDLSAYGSGLYIINAQAEGFEDGSGDSVVTSAWEYISPLKQLVGFKTGKGQSYLKKGDIANVNFIAINPNLEKIALKDLTYQIVEKKYASLLVKNRDGTYAFQSVPRESVVKADKFNIAADGTDFAIPTDAPGDFYFKISDQNGIMLARVNYFVAGEANLNLSIDKNVQLDLKLDKSEYAAGETIQLNITAPYEGIGLITIEKDKVYAHKWFTASTLSSVQTITVPRDLRNNGYVSVSFLRDRYSREIFMPPHTFAVAPFSVDKKRYVTDVRLTVPEAAKPGKPLKIDYAVDKAGKLLIYAVDEGILQVANYKTPDPLSQFLRKIALQVTTYQTVDRFLTDWRVIKAAVGIGGGYYDDAVAAALAENLNPFRRKTEEPVVYWSGIFDVTAGQGSVYYDVPSYFNGSLKVFGVAASEGSVGVGTGQLNIRAPIIVQPNMPVVMTSGDKAEVSVSISNNLPERTGNSVISVEVKANEFFNILGETKKEITLPFGYEGRVDFQVEAKDRFGSGELTFTAASGGESVEISVAASIRPATAYSTVITTGVSERADVTITGFSRDLYADFASREVAASHSPLLISRGLYKYLIDYPHGCTEQIVSQSFPSIMIKGRLAEGGRGDPDKLYNNMLNILRSRQLSNGGFMLWNGGWREVHPYATVYAMHYLTEAKAGGQFVPQDIMEGGIKWLQSYTANAANDLYTNRLQAYAAYVLARNGAVVTAFITNLEERLKKEKDWRSNDIVVYMAGIYKLLKMDEKAADMIRSFVPDTVSRYRFFSDFDSSTLRNSVYLFFLAKHFPDMISKIDVKIVLNLINAIEDQHYNTILSSYSILALYALAEAAEGSDDGLTIFITPKGGKEIPLKADTSGEFPVVSYSEIAERLTAKTAEKGKMGFFLVATEQGFDKTLPKAESKGIEVTRTYHEADGKPKTTFKQGDDVTVRLRLKTNGNRNIIDNVAIVDLLPGAFEMQSTSVSAIQKQAYSGSYRSRLFDYVDVREDRLIFYATVTGSVKEITYKLKVVSKGEYTLPPVYAASMYDPVYRGNTAGDKIKVTE